MFKFYSLEYLIIVKNICCNNFFYDCEFLTLNEGLTNGTYLMSVFNECFFFFWITIFYRYQLLLLLLFLFLVVHFRHLRGGRKKENSKILQN